MTDENKGLPCAAKMWLLAMAIGLGLAVLLPAMGVLTGKWALILGLGFFLIGGALMALLLCSRDAEVEEIAPVVEAPAPDGADAAAAEKAAADKAAADAAAAADTAAAEKAAAEKAAAEKAAADAAAKAAADTSAASEDFDKDGTVEGTDEGSRPEALDGPRDGTADDLKMIKGIGPKLEKLCNSLGFYHFDQIATWSADEVAWVNANLQGFKGRVSRDNWVEQAKTLAAGGTTEFASRVEKGDVYD